MEGVACTWMLLSMCLLGYLIIYVEANEAEVLGNFLKSRLSKKSSSVVHSWAWLNEKIGNSPIIFSLKMDPWRLIKSVHCLVNLMVLISTIIQDM
ncbi:hypothetical protein Gohar_015265 [Gossypium harknessii]|uniref:Uncharacterized protein n=1 Tax=Gossypium harknessii TaxID=34285 RepID=A0A7J9FZ64_9ROSI|nr:hypothetical protein [Gossypium harknessii]